MVALTGTDIYSDLPASRRALESIRWATDLVALQERAVHAVPAAARRKVFLIEQSVDLPASVLRARRRANAAWAVRATTPIRSPRRGRRAGDPPALPRPFPVCVLGHLRRVKDPFRVTAALRRLPEASAIEVVHAGAALSAAMAARARREAARTPRWRWVGDLPHVQALELLARSRVVVLPSLLEGGPGVLSEAIAIGVPVIATRVEGVVGLLGRGHPGLFAPGDTQALTRLLRRAESDPRFLERLARAGARRSSRVSPDRERAAWRDLIARIERRGRSEVRPRRR